MPCTTIPPKAAPNIARVVLTVEEKLTLHVAEQLVAVERWVASRRIVRKSSLRSTLRVPMRVPPLGPALGELVPPPGAFSFYLSQTISHYALLNKATADHFQGITRAEMLNA